MRARADPSPRSFGLLVGGVLAAIGAAALAFGERPLAPWAGGGALALGLSLVVTALWAPGRLERVQAGWMRLARAVAWVNTRVVLAVVYFGMILPMGWVRRLWSDPLALRTGSEASYWVRRERVSDPDAYRRQV